MIKEDIAGISPEELSAGTLAYIGDSVFEMYSRIHVLKHRMDKTNDLHKENIRFVNATSQANTARRILPYLSEKEISIFKRGRNAKSNLSAKNSTIVDYRVATGLEALIGYLYLAGETERLDSLFDLMFTEKRNIGDE
jgi:ribonuclease III family protein